MAATLEDLEQRVARMESELARLQRLVEQPPRDETPAQRGARLMAEARRGKAQLQRSMARAFQEMGIQGPPVPPEKLRELIAECGVQPEDNMISRGINEMREE
jgi:hypothetical protein